MLVADHTDDTCCRVALVDGREGVFAGGRLQQAELLNVVQAVNPRVPLVLSEFSARLGDLEEDGLIDHAERENVVLFPLERVRQIRVDSLGRLLVVVVIEPETFEVQEGSGVNDLVDERCQRAK